MMRLPAREVLRSVNAQAARLGEQKRQTERQHVIERGQAEDAEYARVLAEMEAASKVWSVKQHETDAAFTEFLRYQGELAVRRLSQKSGRLIRMSTPDGVAVDAMGTNLQA